jgi:hypothetical protein
MSFFSIWILGAATFFGLCGWLVVIAYKQPELFAQLHMTLLWLGATAAASVTAYVTGAGNALQAMLALVPPERQAEAQVVQHADAFDVSVAWVAVAYLAWFIFLQLCRWLPNILGPADKKGTSDL